MAKKNIELCPRCLRVHEMTVEAIAIHCAAVSNVEYTPDGKVQRIQFERRTVVKEYVDRYVPYTIPWRYPYGPYVIWSSSESYSRVPDNAVMTMPDLMSTCDAIERQSDGSYAFTSTH